MRSRGPWSESYGAAAAMVVFALVPYLALTAALTPLEPVLSKSLRLSAQSLQLTDGMANAAYAVGTVLAVQFAQHLRQRRMLMLYVTLFLIASVLTAWAPVLLHLAMTVDGGPKQAGLTTALWICFGIALSGFSVALYLFILGRVRLQAPDLDRWQGGEDAAWDTPSLGAGIRARRGPSDLPEWRDLSAAG
jgi:MFS family permease